MTAYVANSYLGDGSDRPYLVRMTNAATMDAARALLGDLAKECTSPDLLALLDGVPDGVVAHEFRALPATRYDQFRGVRSRVGFDAMLDEGFDVS